MCPNLHPGDHVRSKSTPGLVGMLDTIYVADDEREHVQASGLWSHESGIPAPALVAIERLEKIEH